MLRCFAVVVAGLLLSAPAFGQVIYEPVTYQYSAGRSGQHYFYGGNNPLVHMHAQMAANCHPYRFGYAGNIHSFDGGNTLGQPSLLNYHTPVYIDCVGGGITDVSHYGWNGVDARNEAYANAPTYFRKADLLASAVPGNDGVYHVAPSAPQVEMTPVYTAPVSSPATAPSTTQAIGSRAISPKRGQIIIIPKKLLDRPLKDFQNEPQKVASAR
jgi:hypothetical protein